MFTSLCTFVALRLHIFFYSPICLHKFSHFFTLFGPFSPRNGLHFLQQSRGASASAAAFAFCLCFYYYYYCCLCFCCGQSTTATTTMGSFFLFGAEEQKKIIRQGRGDFFTSYARFAYCDAAPFHPRAHVTSEHDAFSTLASCSYHTFSLINLRLRWEIFSPGASLFFLPFC